MSFRQEIDSRRLLNGGLILGAIALAWAFERPRKSAPPPVMETYPAGWTVDPETSRPDAGILRMGWPLWRAVLRRQPGELALVSTWPDDPTMN